MLTLFLANRLKFLISGLFLAGAAFAIKKGFELHYSSEVVKARSQAMDCLDKPLEDVELCLRKKEIIK